VSRSDSGTGIEDQGLSLNEFDEDRDHNWRGGVSRDRHIGETVGLRGRQDNDVAERQGEEEENGRRRRRGGGVERKRKEVRFFFFFHCSTNNNKLIIIKKIIIIVIRPAKPR
jgi:hypothetical protein